MVSRIAVDLWDHRSVTDAIPEILNSLTAHGIAVLSGALPSQVILAEFDRHALRYDEFRQLFESRGQSGGGSSESGDASVVIDRTSVINVKSPFFNTSLYDRWSSLLARIIASVGTVHVGGQERRIDCFNNFYIRSDDRTWVSEHIDSSIMTLLSCAVDLRDVRAGPVPGFEYWSLRTEAFVPLIPEDVTDLILMCGRDSALFRGNEGTYPPVRHRVMKPSDTDAGRRFTMVMKML